MKKTKFKQECSLRVHNYSDCQNVKISPDERINSEFKTSLFAAIPIFRIFGYWYTLGGGGLGAVRLHPFPPRGI